MGAVHGPPDAGTCPVPLPGVVAAAVAGIARHRLPLQSAATNSTRTTTSTSAATRPARSVWHSEDHYLDLVVRTGEGVELDDIDELLTAVRHGLLTPEIGEQAVRSALDADRGSVPPRLRPRTVGFLATAWTSPGAGRNVAAMSPIKRGLDRCRCPGHPPGRLPVNFCVRAGRSGGPAAAGTRRSGRSGSAAQHRLPRPRRRCLPRCDDFVRGRGRPNPDGQPDDGPRPYLRGQYRAGCLEAGEHAGVDRMAVLGKSDLRDPRGRRAGRKGRGLHRAASFACKR